MKNILLIVLLAISVTSCQKKHCWVCTYSNANTNTQTVYCDKTKSEINDIENMPATDVNAQPVAVDCDKQ